MLKIGGTGKGWHRWLLWPTPIRVRHVGVGGGWVEARLVGACAVVLHGRGHLIVEAEDGFFGAIAAVRGEVFAFDDGEGFQDVIHVVAGDTVEVEVGGVEFAAQEEAAGFVPAEGGPL